MTRPLRLRVGDREIWLVPAAALERWSGAHAAWMLREAIASWPTLAAIRSVADTMLAPPQTPALPWLLDAFERGRCVAIRHARDGAGMLARSDDGSDDDAPRLASLCDVATDARTRRDGGRGTVEPGATPGREPDTATGFVAFVVVDDEGRPLHGAWSIAPGGAPARGSFAHAPVRVERVDPTAGPLTLQLSAVVTPGAPDRSR